MSLELKGGGLECREGSNEDVLINTTLVLFILVRN